MIGVAGSTTAGNGGRLGGILSKAIGTVFINVEEFDIDDTSALIRHLRGVINGCIAARSRLLILMPDTIFADGSILNMRRYAMNKPVCVAAPHLRVNADQFIALKERIVYPPRRLVDRALRCAHQSQACSYTQADHGTLYGGIALTKLDEHTTTIIHYLPTVYLACFDERDATHFQEAHDFGAWDHTWPNHLADVGRLRVFGSSDLFFAVELTEPGSNQVPVLAGSALEEDCRIGLPWLKCFVGELKS